MAMASSIAVAISLLLFLAISSSIASTTTPVQEEVENPENSNNVHGTTTEESSFAVVGYLPEWRYEGANFETLCEHLTHLILFSIEPTASGGITAIDRIPSADILREISAACSSAPRRKAKVLICFGGNGRSAGFSRMVRSSESRSRFVQSLVELCLRHRFDGVDYNWEYPGYVMGRGYQNQTQIEADYDGLANLVKETRMAFDQHNIQQQQQMDDNHGSAERMHSLDTITMAYYPDTRQERLLVEHKISDNVDFMHSMSYDQTGKHHSDLAFGIKTADQVRDTPGFPRHKATLGLPFYGRYSVGGDWVTYEDIVQQFAPLPPSTDVVKDPARDKSQYRQLLGFNGRDTIRKKVLYAKKLGLGGVMIWEAGQDCRIHPVTRHGQTHVVTCPDGSESSLLVAISDAIQKHDDKKRERIKEEPEL